MPAVNPEILIWARETAGLSLEDAAKALGFADTKSRTATERLAAMEHGEEEPSRPTLLKMSEQYRRGLLVFYLEKPPRKDDRGQDFRTLPDASSQSDALLDALIRDLKVRQSLVRDILEEDSEGVTSLGFVGSARIDEGVESVAQQIVSTIDFDIRVFRRMRRADRAFGYLRNQIESIGIFVLLVGDLGSHHSTISTESFRGFVISDLIAPFIAVNSQDAKVAQSFTALHETVHLWLGNTGVSGSFAFTGVERFCNDVAAEILVPRSELKEVQPIQALPFAEVVEAISRFAESRIVSRQMVAYRFYRQEIITDSQWRELSSYFDQEWRNSVHSEKEKEISTSGGPSYYDVRRSRLSPALLALVNRSVREGTLTPTKAGTVLGVKPRSVEPLLKGSSRQGGR